MFALAQFYPNLIKINITTLEVFLHLDDDTMAAPAESAGQHLHKPALSRCLVGKILQSGADATSKLAEDHCRFSIKFI
jgi:hypothetical protein